VQYYLEQTLQHDELRANSPTPQFEPDEFRQTVTLRLRYRALRETLIFGLFSFYGVSDRDAHLRPSVIYQVSDQITATVGANVMVGANNHTFFGQLEDDNQVYARLRYSF